MSTPPGEGKPAAPPRLIDLQQALHESWYKFPLAIMRDVGSAVQTFAGFIKVANSETFVPTEDIAKASRLPLKTTRTHLALLNERGWIKNAGRQRTRRGAPRRTCTRRITAAGKSAMSEYAVLPWWAACRINGIKPGRRDGTLLPWGTKAVLSVIMARLMGVQAAMDQPLPNPDLDPDDFWLSIELLGDERFRFSLRKSHRSLGHSLEEQTGLSCPAIIDAKHNLARLGIVRWERNQTACGGDDRDSLCPRKEFKVVETPAGVQGRVYLSFDGGKKPANRG